MNVSPCGYWEKRWGGGKFTKAGLPDMHIVVNGKSLDIELKASHGRLSELQKVIINQINNSGARAIVAFPKDFDLVKNEVERMIHDDE